MGLHTVSPAGAQVKAMKVNDPNLANVNSDALRGTGLDRAQQTESISRRGTGGAASADESTDQVSLSGFSEQLRAAHVDSPERVAHIEKLSNDVATGNYQADAAAVSHSIVESALRPKE